MNARQLALRKKALLLEAEVRRLGLRIKGQELRASLGPLRAALDLGAQASMLLDLVRGLWAPKGRQ